MNTSASEPKKKTRVLILGGGFGGCYTALQLDKTIAANPDIEVTLVSRENFLLFTPMLHEVASGDLGLADIVCSQRQMLKHVRCVEADVAAIDFEARQVTVFFGVTHQRKKFNYDHLVIALGSEPNFFKLPGVEQLALTMKSSDDALLLRNQTLAMLELASLTEDAAARRAMLTFVVAGGGFAGVETVGALNDLVRETITFFPMLANENPRIVLVHPNEVILPELGERLGRYAQGKLASRKVEIRTNARVEAFSERGVELNGGEVIVALTLVWTAGVTPAAVVQTLPCKKEKGRIVVEETLAVPGFPGVWALGDCAWIPNPKTGQPHPPTAQHAIREAVQCAKNIAAMVRGEPLRPFRFTTLGQLASIGHHIGVAQVFGINFSGFSAWLMWRLIYLAKLPRFEKKLRVALGWSLDLFFFKDLSQPLTLHGADRIQRRLAYVRQHPFKPSADSEMKPAKQKM